MQAHGPGRTMDSAGAPCTGDRHQPSDAERSLAAVFAHLRVDSGAEPGWRRFSRSKHWQQLDWVERKRLDNAIWRAWFMWSVYGKHTPYVRFRTIGLADSGPEAGSRSCSRHANEDPRSESPTAVRPFGTCVLEGRYWTRPPDSILFEYQQWRRWRVTRSSRNSIGTAPDAAASAPTADSAIADTGRGRSICAHGDADSAAAPLHAHDASMPSTELRSVPPVDFVVARAPGSAVPGMTDERMASASEATEPDRTNALGADEDFGRLLSIDLGEIASFSSTVDPGASMSEMPVLDDLCMRLMWRESATCDIDDEPDGLAQPRLHRLIDAAAVGRAMLPLTLPSKREIDTKAGDARHRCPLRVQEHHRRYEERILRTDQRREAAPAAVTTAGRRHRQAQIRRPSHSVSPKMLRAACCQSRPSQPAPADPALVSPDFAHSPLDGPSCDTCSPSFGVPSITRLPMHSASIPLTPLQADDMRCTVTAPQPPQQQQHLHHQPRVAPLLPDGSYRPDMPTFDVRALTQPHQSQHLLHGKPQQRTAASSRRRCSVPAPSVCGGLPTPLGASPSAPHSAWLGDSSAVPWNSAHAAFQTAGDDEVADRGWIPVRQHSAPSASWAAAAATDRVGFLAADSATQRAAMRSPPLPRYGCQISGCAIAPGRPGPDAACSLRTGALSLVSTAPQGAGVRLDSPPTADRLVGSPSPAVPHPIAPKGPARESNLLPTPGMLDGTGQSAGARATTTMSLDVPVGAVGAERPCWCGLGEPTMLAAPVRPITPRDVPLALPLSVQRYNRFAPTIPPMLQAPSSFADTLAALREVEVMLSYVTTGIAATDPLVGADAAAPSDPDAHAATGHATTAATVIAAMSASPPKPLSPLLSTPASALRLPLPPPVAAARPVDRSLLAAASLRPPRQRLRGPAERTLRPRLSTLFDRLQAILPSRDGRASTSRLNQSALLYKAANHIAATVRQRDSLRRQCERLRCDIAALRAATAQLYHTVSERHPIQPGTVPQAVPDDATRLYRDYTRRQCTASAAYVIFSAIADQLWESYSQRANGQTMETLSATLFAWVDQCCNADAVRQMIHAAIVRLQRMLLIQGSARTTAQRHPHRRSEGKSSMPAAAVVAAATETAEGRR